MARHGHGELRHSQVPKPDYHMQGTGLHRLSCLLCMCMTVAVRTSMYRVCHNRLFVYSDAGAGRDDSVAPPLIHNIPAKGTRGICGISVANERSERK